MPLELDGPRKKVLRDALIHAYPDWDSLSMMVSDQLGMVLTTVTSQSKNITSNAFELISHAEAHGELAELLAAARNGNPKNPKLLQFAASCGVASVSAPVLEKIVGPNNTFFDTQVFIEGLTLSEVCVCRIDYCDDGVGTGFLVGPDLVLTNHHVVTALLANTADVANWSCRFDYKASPQGRPVSKGRAVPFHQEWRIDDSPPSDVDVIQDPKPRDPTDDELDYALVRLAEPVGNQPVASKSGGATRGWLKLATNAINYDSKRVVFILQHPTARPLQLAFSAEQSIKTNVAKNRIRHTVPTEPGSSGSPVFDAEWKLIALHHSGDPKFKNPEYNEAIPIAKIAARPKVAAAIA